MILENVTSSGWGAGLNAGILADRPGRVRGMHVTVSDNAEVGMWVGKAKITGLTATGNGDPLPNAGPLGGGVFGSRVVFLDSSISGNFFRGVPGDVVTGRRPRLVNPTCGSGVQLTSDLTLDTWGVCSDD
jgi:hypothetical protein